MQASRSLMCFHLVALILLPFEKTTPVLTFWVDIEKHGAEPNCLSQNKVNLQMFAFLAAGSQLPNERQPKSHVKLLSAKTHIAEIQINKKAHT